MDGRWSGMLDGRLDRGGVGYEGRLDGGLGWREKK